MQTNKKIALISLLVSLSAVTAIGVSLAWYQIEVNALASYDGASIGNYTRFQIGLKSEATLYDAKTYSLVEDPDNPGIYWAEGNIDSDCLKYYLDANGYSNNTLDGVTSGSFGIDGDNFILKSKPNYLSNYSLTEPANKKNYVYFDFVFKFYKDSTLQSTGNIYLRDAFLTGQMDVYHTTRMYLKSKTFSSIVNLNSDESGSDLVGGILDLNKDGLFDTTSESYEESPGVTGILKKEYPYGEFYNDISYGTTGNPEIVGGHDFVDCFNAKHEEGSLSFINASPKSASYYGKKEIIDDHLSLCKIDKENKYAELQTTIYLEGWDKKYVENVGGMTFGLNLMFESDISEK